MTKQKTIERITSYLPHLGEDVLSSVLTLLENTQFEDDEWDLQMQQDGQAGLLNDLIDEALDEFEQGESQDLFKGLDERAERNSVS